MRKAEILRHRLVEDAERMRKIDPAVLEISHPAAMPQAALEKSPNPSTETTAASLEGRHMEGRGQMRKMMLYRMEFRANGLPGKAPSSRAGIPARARRLRNL